jgi:hypothetical protein
MKGSGLNGSKRYQNPVSSYFLMSQILLTCYENYEISL